MRRIDEHFGLTEGASGPLSNKPLRATVFWRTSCIVATNYQVNFARTGGASMAYNVDFTLDVS
jgi:hypothetical protein